MKCPHCDAWNQAYLPKCVNCGFPLTGNTQKKKNWEEAMHKKRPSLQVAQFEPGEKDVNLTIEDDQPFDSEVYDNAMLTDEMEDLMHRRKTGAERLAQIKEQAARVHQSIQQAEVVRLAPDPVDSFSNYADDSAAIRLRQKQRQEQYSQFSDVSESDGYDVEPDDSSYGVFGDSPDSQPFAYDDDDEQAPIYYDGYTPDSGDQAAFTDEEYMPRRIQTRKAYQENYDNFYDEGKKAHKFRWILLRTLIFILCCGAFAFGGILFAKYFTEQQGIQAKDQYETRVELTKTTYDGHPAHTITIYGRENATVYLREIQSSYVIADGKVEVTVPDYMWYDTESSTFATPVDTDTMDVTVTPFIRYSQEGDQFALDPVNYTIDVPLSPVNLLNPPTMYMEVGVSIFEIRLNVELGSTVIIDGTNVSTLIRETGNVSKNVQVLPVGENVISISVKSKYCRENKMEVTLYRAEQDIQLELDATVLVEWNYEPITEAAYNSADEKTKASMQLPTISGTTEPGAIITVDFPHWGLEQDLTTGKFSFKPIFSELGDNEVKIRASYEGRSDSVISHIVYYMPNADIYTRRAWDLNAQYNDLVNYISIRKGTIYRGIGTITRVISSAPQMAIMELGDGTISKQVMLENSSKTTWEVGTKYMVFGEAYGLYDTMPRLTVRYTYLSE